MAGADALFSRLWRRRRRTPARRVGIAGFIFSAHLFAEMLALRGLLHLHGRHELALEHGHADDANVVGPTGARGISIFVLGEVERRHSRQALTPAGNRHRSPGSDYISTLRRSCGLTSDDVDTVDRYDSENVLAGVIANAQLILIAGAAGDIALAIGGVDRKTPAMRFMFPLLMNERQRCKRRAGTDGVKWDFVKRLGVEK